jgi:lysophospholipase L1-like esterase
MMSTSRLQVAARGLLTHSQTAMRLGLWLRARRAPGAPAPTAHAAAPATALATMRVPREEYVENLLEIARLAQAHGAVPVLIGPVYRDRVSHPPEGDDIAAHRTALREAAAELGLLYFEIPELTEDAHPGNAALFEEHIHPNHKGHKLMAERLLAFLRDHHALGTLAAP